MNKSKILIEWKDDEPDRIVLTFDGKPEEMIVAMVNALANITRSVGKPESLREMVITVSQEYQSRVFSERLTSVTFDMDGDINRTT